MPDGVSLGVLLYIPYRDMERRILEALRRQGHTLSRAQGQVAARLDEGGSRLGPLAEASGTTKQNASFLVGQLEAQGYVERVADPDDARARLIRLTERGREAQRLANAEERRIEDEWRAHLGSAGFERLRQELERLREATDPYL